MLRRNGFFVKDKINTFKKYNCGQASFEYFILFILLAFFCLLTTAAGSSFKDSITHSTQKVYQQAVAKILE